MFPALLLMAAPHPPMVQLWSPVHIQGFPDPVQAGAAVGSAGLELQRCSFHWWCLSISSQQEAQAKPSEQGL